MPGSLGRSEPVARDAVVFGGAVLAIALVATALRTFPRVSPTTVAMALLLVILGTATAARLRVAVVASIVAVLTLNYFFLPPIGAFTISDPQNWIALVAFLAAGLIASNLSAAAQNRAREAEERRTEVTRLFDLTRDVLLTTETAGAIDVLARHVARRFELASIAVCLPADAGWRVHQGGADEIRIETGELDTALARARGTLEFDAYQRAYGGHVRTGPGGSISIVPLRHGTRAVGLLAAVAPALDIGALDAVAGVVAIAIERSQFLEERDAAQLARQKADLASTLLASVSHDIRTPLTAVRVAVENLRGDLAPEDRQSQAHAAIAEVDRLASLVRDILDMARIDAGALEMTREWVPIAEIVDAAAAHVRPSLERHVLEVETDDVEVDVDPRLTSVALSHLLDNAARYSPDGTVLSVRGRAESGELRLSVTDHGAGLDPEELDHLFERFYRGRTGRQGTFGTGMGLSITRGLLAAEGGRVWGENAPDAGARFTIAVPTRVRYPAVADS